MLGIEELVGLDIGQSDVGQYVHGGYVGRDALSTVMGTYVCTGKG